MSKSVGVEVANIKEAMTGLNNEKVITPYSLNQVIKRKAGSGSSTPGVGLNYYWNGTELGVKREDEENYTFVNLQGPSGSDGEDGAPGTPGADGTNGVDGVDGREIDLQVTATHIQWRYVGDISWLNLIELSLLKGADGADGVDGTNGVDGKQVQLQKGTTHIQWKYDTDVTWTNLVALIDLKGADGTNGVDGAPGADGQGVPVGGSTDQVLVKKTAADYDFEWRNPSGGITLLDVYPVGSIYLSVNNTNPGTLFGGTWVAWGSGRVPVGVDTSQTEFNSVEKTGGAKTHTLTVAQMPSHNHNTQWRFSGGDNGSYAVSWTSDYWQGPYDNALGAFTMSNTGGGQAHNNLQPFITCYMWKRTD